MGVKEVLAKLATDKAIRAVFPLEGQFYEEVITEERSITESSFGMPLINRALKEVLKRKAAVCVFCGMDFEVPTDHVMIMEDALGNIVGHDVPRCMADDFKDDPSIMWLCDDFAIFPERGVTEEVMIVMLPQKVKFVGESEGVKDPVLLYPAPTTDTMLKKHFGMSLDDAGIASAILAFDVT